MRHPRALKWEAALKRVFDEIDHELEEKYGAWFRLHEKRPGRGETANPEMDGLFNVGAAFSPGFGSKHGPGYVVDIRIATQQRVPEDVRKKIETEVVRELREKLPQAFPGRELKVEKENHVYKIIGDLRLDWE